MGKLFILLLMIFLHIVADYNLQGWLASAKRKSFWEENAPDPQYKHDYICALIIHAFAWSFMIMLPVFYIHGFSMSPLLLELFLGNTAFHAMVDDSKANRKVLNLWQDQLFHMLQILITAAFCVFM